MRIKDGAAFYGTLCTATPTTGEGLDPTSISGYIYLNGARTAVSVTATDDGTTQGITKLSGTLPGGYTEGDIIELVAVATVNSVTATKVLWVASLETTDLSELALASAVAAIPTTSDYPTAITYNGNGDIDTVTWFSGAVWEYAYDGSYNLTSVAEA